MDEYKDEPMGWRARTGEKNKKNLKKIQKFTCKVKKLHYIMHRRLKKGAK